MKKIILCGLVIVVLIYYKQIKQFILHQVPAKWCTAKMVYDSIKNLQQPTFDDYQRLQTYLSQGRRPYLSRLKDYEKRIRHLRFVGKKPDEAPVYEKVLVNCSEDEKTNCLLIYATYNKGFSKGLKRLVEHVKASDFKGHILYRIGGWPNLEEGDLRFAHIPYAFKPCFFREARRLGYKNVLWLDTSVQPLVSLNQVFEEIEKKGIFTLANGWKVGPFMNSAAAEALGISLEETYQIPSCSAGLFGVDFKNEKAAKVLDQWYQKARHPEAYFSQRSDQNVLSIILYQAGFHDLFPAELLVDICQPISEKAFFIIDRSFVHQ